MKIFHSCLTLLSMFALTACGYSVTGANDGDKMAITVPLIRSDDNGIFRDALAKELSNSSKFRYRSSPSTRYQLKIDSKRDKTETVGYAWDRNPTTGDILNVLYPTEGRREMTVKVTVFDTVKKKSIGDPIVISRHVDYDFVNPTAQKWIFFTDASGNRRSTLQYSLGQLDSEEGAKLESYEPLYKILAKEIIYLLEHQTSV